MTPSISPLPLAGCPSDPGNFWLEAHDCSFFSQNMVASHEASDWKHQSYRHCMPTVDSGEERAWKCSYSTTFCMEMPKQTMVVKQRKESLLCDESWCQASL